MLTEQLRYPLRICREVGAQLTVNADAAVGPIKVPCCQACVSTPESAEVTAPQVSALFGEKTYGCIAC